MTRSGLSLEVELLLAAEYGRCINERRGDVMPDGAAAVDGPAHAGTTGFVAVEAPHATLPDEPAQPDGGTPQKDCGRARSTSLDGT